MGGRGMRTPKNELTNDVTVLKIMELLKKREKTENELIAYLGLANGTFTKWKYHDAKSYRLHLDKIAEYLDTELSYLDESVEDIVNLSNLTKNEIQLVKYYRKMGKTQKELLMKTADCFVESTECRKNKL